MSLSRLIRVLIVIFMILIMIFLFLIARTIYLGNQQEIAESSLETEAPPAAARTETMETTTEKEPEKSSPAQSVAISELETLPTMPESEPEPSAEPEKSRNLSSGRILIGDSRFAYWTLQQISLDPGFAIRQCRSSRVSST